TGTDRRISRISSQFASRTRTESISAYEASTHLRWQPFRVPVQFGDGYAFSSGGQSGQYQQSGLQGNASYFTGTPSLISLYNEALRAELGNLRVITSFISYNGENDDLSLIYNNFRKVRGNSPIITDNVNAPTIGHNSEVGNGLDLVATHYFDLGLQLGNLIGS
ncbi:alginate export family protein, partial [Haloarcula sp. Atlit-120R]|uniref:alginate export family protein n=1 Tax=Haloarcula sp. Atlit-120R TaxID=2282135 RepID=UPI000FED0330